MARKQKQINQERQLQGSLYSPASPDVANTWILVGVGVILIGLCFLLIGIEQDQGKILTNVRSIDNRIATLEKNTQANSAWFAQQIKAIPTQQQSPFCYVDMPSGARMFTVDGRLINTMCDLNKTVMPA